LNLRMFAIIHESPFFPQLIKACICEYTFNRFRDKPQCARRNPSFSFSCSSLFVSFSYFFGLTNDGRWACPSLLDTFDTRGCVLPPPPMPRALFLNLCLIPRKSMNPGQKAARQRAIHKPHRRRTPPYNELLERSPSQKEPFLSHIG